MNTQAWERFEKDMEACRRKIERVCYSVVRRQPDPTSISEDLTQATMLKAFQKGDSFHRECELGTWLSKIARNLSLDFLRNCKRKDDRTLSVETLITSNEDEVHLAFDPMVKGDTEEIYLNRITIRRLLNSLNAPDRRMVVMLMNGWSYKEIALSMNKCEGTVKSRVNRVRVRMRQNLVGKQRFL